MFNKFVDGKVHLQCAFYWCFSWSKEIQFNYTVKGYQHHWYPWLSWIYKEYYEKVK